MELSTRCTSTICAYLAIIYTIIACNSVVELSSVAGVVSPLHAAVGHVSVTANSAHSILLSQNFTESRVYYVCEVMEVGHVEKRKVNRNVTTKVTGLLPDTTYRVDCVAYHSDGVEYCLEANTTVTTRELCTFSKSDCTYVRTLCENPTKNGR